MANVQLENGYIQIANELVEKIYQQPLTSSEFRVVLFILRKTWGWKKKEDKISLSQIAQEVGIPRSNSCDIITSLVAKRLLVKTKGKINTIRFNKNYEEWMVAKRLPPSRSTTTTLVAKQRPELVATVRHTKESIKETITKEITTNVVSEFGNSQINECRDYFLKVFQLPKEDGSIKWNRIYWSNLIKASKTGVQGVKWLIDQAHEDNFLRPNITSAKALSNKQVLIISRKREGVSYGSKHNIDARNVE